MLKNSKIYNIFATKCPHCRERNMFPTKLFSFRGLLDMPKHCPSCGIDFEPEPGFYWGAMYIAYGLSSFVLLAVAAVCMIGFEMELYPTWGVLVVVAILGFMYNARLSRAIWLSFWHTYDPDWRKKKAERN